MVNPDVFAPRTPSNLVRNETRYLENNPYLPYDRLGFRRSVDITKPALTQEEYEKSSVVAQEGTGFYSYSLYKQTYDNAYESVNKPYSTEISSLLKEPKGSAFTTESYEKFKTTIAKNVQEALPKVGENEDKTSEALSLFYLGTSVRNNQTHMFWGLQRDQKSDVQWFHVNYAGGKDSKMAKFSPFDMQSELKDKKASIDIEGVGIDLNMYEIMLNETAQVKAEGSSIFNLLSWSCATAAARVMKSGDMENHLYGGRPGMPQATGKLGVLPNALMQWFKNSSKTFTVY